MKDTHKSIVFREHNTLDRYILSHPEFQPGHYRKTTNGSAIEVFYDECWESVHSNTLKVLIDDPCFGRVLRNRSKSEIKSWLKKDILAEYLPDSTLWPILSSAYQGLVGDLKNVKDLPMCDVRVYSRRVLISRSNNKPRKDIRRQIVVRIHKARDKAETTYIDWPLRSAKPFHKLDWNRALRNAYAHSCTYFSDAIDRGHLPDRDRIDIVFEGGVGAIAVHEACGHHLETDLCVTGSAFSNKLNQAIAGKHLTLVDNPCIPGAMGSYRIDDEGKKAGPTFLVEQGCLKTWLDSMRYPACDQKQQGANGRRDSYRNPAYPRMSNLVVLPGNTGRLEMIKNVTQGIFVNAIGVGGESYPGSSGDFAIAVKDGRWIENGRIGKPVGRFIIRGNALDFLKGIALIGKQSKYKPLATLCEKNGQRIFTDGLSPPFLVKNLEIQKFTVT